MHNWAGEINGPGKGKKYSPCTFLWQALIIFWDGAVLPCTQDFFGYYILGNVKDSSLAEIWNNDKMIRLRKKFWPAISRILRPAPGATASGGSNSWASPENISGNFCSRECPERTVLYRVLFHYFDRFLAEYESRFEREYGFLRPIVKEVVERYSMR